MEMTTEDQGDYIRLEKLLERLARPYIVSARKRKLRSSAVDSSTGMDYRKMRNQ